MKKLISLLLTVGLMSTLFVACTAEEETVSDENVFDETGFNQYLSCSKTEIFNALDITQDDVGELANGEIILLPETENYLGYDFSVMLVFSSTDDDAKCLYYKYYLDFCGDTEGALNAVEDLYNQCVELYGEMLPDNTSLAYDYYDDKASLINTEDNFDFYAEWDLGENGFSEAEDILIELNLELYDELSEYADSLTFTSQVGLHSSSNGEIINVYIQNYLNL